jgi:dipeptidyl aminopeptidase/acylaminoacyl peptidase
VLGSTRSAGAALLFVAMTAHVPAHASPATRWTIDDVVRTETADDLAVSRDGRAAVWVRSTVETVDGEEKRIGNLWLTRLEPSPAAPGDPIDSIPLTRSRNHMASPAFSPNGRRIAFLTDRKAPGHDGGQSDRDEPKGNQVWVIPTDGGEAYPVTRFDRPVKAFGWIDDETLAIAAPESKSAWELEREKRHDDARVVDDAEHEPPVRVFRLRIGTGSGPGTAGATVTRLTTNEDWVDSLAVSPDGRLAVVTAQQSLSYEFDSKVPPHTRLVDLETGDSLRILTGSPDPDDPQGSRRLLPRTVRWAPDGSGFYFVDEYSTDPRYRMATVSRLFHHTIGPAGEEGTTVQVDLRWDRGLGRGYGTIPGGVVALLADGVRDRLARYDLDGDRWVKTELEGEHVGAMDGIVTAPDGETLLYQHSTATTPFQLYTAGLPDPSAGRELGEPTRFTELNPSFEGKPTGRVEVVHFPGARGDEVEALLHYPLDRDPNDRHTRPAPLLLDIHGGPAGRDRDSWDQRWPAPGLLWRQRGAFVLQINYHGSAGYGLEWVESIGGGTYYELEAPDLLAGVDWAIEQGLADPDRLGSVGWSNGGILTAELITRTDRFKVASVGAADVEWISDWANVKFGASFDNYYFGAPPWEAPELYVEKSPFFRLTEVTTPTVIFTGTEDVNVPPHQSWNLFRVLQQLERTEVRLVLFPGEPHGLREIASQRRKIEENLAWLDRYLFEPESGTEPSEARKAEAIRPGSRLEALVERSRAARATDGRFGVKSGAGPLVPETVSFAGLEVGRFEVTRSQWQAFDETLQVARGEENLPVTGVGFERAREYAAWLAEQTGRAFRLPTTEEAETLAKAAGEGGNTLDRWAGYTPNPDDAAAIREALEERVPERAPLLLPVGSAAGKKDTDGAEPVFDLDGNAAEWAVREDGAGKPVGPSADRSTDPRGDGGEPAAEYTGLRVIVDD